MWSKQPFPFVKWKYKLFYLFTLLLLTEIICLPHWNILEYSIMPVPFLWLCCVKHHCFISTLTAASLMATAVSKALHLFLLSCERWQIQLLRGEARPSLGTWDASLKNTISTIPTRNVENDSYGQRDFPLSLSHKALCLSPGMCYGVDSGVGSVFKCWEVGKTALPLRHQHHTDMALYFSTVSLAQSVQTWGFLLRALLSDTVTSWPGATTPLDPSSHSWRHCSLQGLLSEQGGSCATAKSWPLHETATFISAKRSSNIQMDNFKIF